MSVGNVGGHVSDFGNNNNNSVIGNVGGDVYFGTSKGIDKILAPVLEAAYDCQDQRISPCHPGTRKVVIAKLNKWADGRGPPICWLRGPAGSGKSALSLNFAQDYHKKGKLIGSFFFLRGVGDRSTIPRLVPTLSYQLYHHVPDARAAIESALHANPRWDLLDLAAQLQKLFIEPIHASRGILSRLKKKPIIVIDALDECDDKEPMKRFIEAIIQISQLPVRILITSRVEEHIRSTLESPAAISAIYSLSLEDFDAHADIRSFFQSHLTNIYHQKRRIMLDVSAPWPSQSDLDRLVEQSDGSFIFATTLIKLIDGEGFPQDNLRDALAVTGLGLDPLYMQIFKTIPDDDTFKRALGTIMLLTEPIPIVFLAHLLQLRSVDIVHRLLGVQSILMIPGEDHQPVRLFHTSLRDFLTSPERSDRFFINPPPRHLSIAADCLRVISTLPMDDIFYEEKQTYACLNWCHHLERGVIDAGNDLASFLSNVPLASLLINFGLMDVWFNTSLRKRHHQMGALRSVISAVKAVQRLPPDLVQGLEHFERYFKVYITCMLKND